MRRKIPENWKTLYVRDLVVGGTFPNDLRIFRKPSKSKKIYAKWLPLIEEDRRAYQGRINRIKGLGKRLPIEASMRTDDPIDAANYAVRWWREKSQQLEIRNQLSLHKYWESWSVRAFAKEQRNAQAQKKYRRDTQLKWDGEGYGIKHQSWSVKSVDEISFADFADYFSLLEKRARKNNGTNGSGIKEQQKSMIRALMKESRIDFPHLQIPEFPPISRQTKQVIHLNRDQMELLIRTIQKRCDFVVNKEINYKQYQELQWSKSKRMNQRNWVDLYDALLLEWFFFLRSEDMYRLKSEWFQDDGTGQYDCLLDETKGNRPIHKTRSYRIEADRFMKRMKLRRPKKGYLIFPEIPRPDEGGAENKVRNTLNYLLRQVVAECLPDFDLGQKCWTTIRHTSIRLMLQDDPSLWQGNKLRDFADNCHTSADQIQTTYLTPIQAELTAKQTRENIRSKGWSGGLRVKV